MSPPATLSTRKKLLFSFVTLIVFFAGAEGTIRLFGFKYETRVGSMEFTFPLDRYDIATVDQEELMRLMGRGIPVMQRDPILFWKPAPGLVGHNSRGVHGPEFDVPKRPGMFRVVCLGDSCTHFGPDSYATHLQQSLRSRRSDPVEVINAGVAGYTSHQGLARLRTEVVDWEPDVVTVYFGWNDHWLARGVADREQKPLNELQHLLRRYRVYQLLLATKHSVVPPYRTTYRVSLPDYDDNLREIHRSCREMNAETIFITAPHALDLGVPEYLTAIGEVADANGLVALHESYNEVVRRVANEMDVPLVDLDREFAARDKTDLFIEDHIHLSQQGRILVGQLIDAAIQGAGFF